MWAGEIVQAGEGQGENEKKERDYGSKTLTVAVNLGCAVAATLLPSVKGDFVLTCFLVVGFSFCSACHNSEYVGADVMQAFSLHVY